MRKVASLRRLAVGGAVLTALMTVALVASSLAGAAKVQPVFLPGASNTGKDCVDNQGTQSWTQLKIDPNADGVYSDGTLQVTISNTQNDKTFDWSSNIGVDAVIVKGGSDGSYLYRYDPPTEETSDTGLTTPGTNAISHISVCYDVAPTGSLTVVKKVVNDDAGQAGSDDWTMNVAGRTPLSFPGADDPGTTNTVDPGAYTVTESGGPTGYSLTYSGDCDANGNVTVAVNDEKTCVLTNDDNDVPPPGKGRIIVEKQTSPNGAPGSFSFTGDATGAIGDGGQIVVSDLEPGSYSSSEAAAAGWLLTSIVCDDEDSSGNLGQRTASFEVDAGETVTCVFTNAQVITGRGSISVSKSANPTSVQEPGGPVGYSVTITNTSNVLVTITNVVDDKFGDLDDSGGNGCFDVPINMTPGSSTNCQFTAQVTGVAGTSHVNTVTATGGDEFGNPVSGSDDAKVDITPRLIDLVIVKDASSPTPLNGVVNYSLTVTNKGPDTATNVQVADPAPAGITYLTASPSQGTCSVTAALVTCGLGTIAPGQSVAIAITGRATAVGSHTNTATVTGSGGRETNPADNVDSAVTIVPAPLRPPTTSTPKPTPKPKPAPEVCLTLTVTPKMIKADGTPDRVVATVRAASKAKAGAKVLVKGRGIRKSDRTNNKGVAVVTINPRTPGLITVTTIDAQKSCGAKRIGVVGVFLPPLTG